MGAIQSSHCENKPSIDDVPNAKINPSTINPDATTSIPRGPSGTPMPTMMRPETFEEKLYRKVRCPYGILFETP